MPLTPQQIKALLALPERKRQPKTGGRSGTGKLIDVTFRTYQTWFQLAHHLFDQETLELAHCQNPNCLDERGKKNTITAEVNGVYMCRICFLAGYMSEDPDQTKLDLGSE